MCRVFRRFCYGLGGQLGLTTTWGGAVIYGANVMGRVLWCMRNDCDVTIAILMWRKLRKVEDVKWARDNRELRCTVWMSLWRFAKLEIYVGSGRFCIASTSSLFCYLALFARVRVVDSMSV